MTKPIPILVALAASLAACTTLLGGDFEIVPSGSGGTGAAGGSGAAGGGTGGNVGGGGATGDGPQLIGSTPEDGAADASVSPFGQLFFDRAVSVEQAAGKVTMSDGATTDTAQVEPCLDASPSCIRFVAPPSLAPDALLAGGTAYTVTIDESFQDPDGNTNDVDTTFSFTTFDYEPTFFEPMSVDDDVGGLAYVGGAVNALYIAGTGSLNFNGPDVERVRLDAAFAPMDASVVAQPNFFNLGSCSGGSSLVSHQLDYWNTTLYLSASECDAVYTMPVDQTSGDLPDNQQGSISGTSLSAPDDALYRVEGTVVFDLGGGSGEEGLFGQGTIGLGPVSTGILERRPLALQFWVVWAERDGFIGNAPFYLGGGTDGGGLVTYVAAGDTIHKLRQDTAEELNAHTIDGASFESPQLRVDAEGRLYVGDASRLVVYDTSGFNGFSELAVREGVDFRRFDIRPEGDTTHVYFTDFGGRGTIRHLALDF